MAVLLTASCGSKRRYVVVYGSPGIRAAIKVAIFKVKKNWRQGRLSIDFSIRPAAGRGSSRPMDAKLTILLLGGRGQVVRRIEVGTIRSAWPRFKSEWRKPREVEDRFLAGLPVKLGLKLKVGRRALELTRQVRLEVNF